MTAPPPPKKLDRVLALPIVRCDDCGDELVALPNVYVCAPCRRRAALRGRMVYVAARRISRARARLIVGRLSRGLEAA